MYCQKIFRSMIFMLINITNKSVLLSYYGVIVQKNCIQVATPLFSLGQTSRVSVNSLTQKRYVIINLDGCFFSEKDIAYGEA